MKKYASLILFAFLLNGCDDGDLNVETINFESVTTSQACNSTTNTLIYKLKDQEALLLQMPEGSIINDDSTYVRTIDSKGNGQYRVVYRAYDGKVVTDNICGVIPPSSPKVTQEWLGTDGVINIVSKPQIVSNTTNDGNHISGYTHTITFNNITFAKPSGDQTQAKYTFGIYTTSQDAPNFSFIKNPNGTIYECANVKRVFNYNTSFYVSIDDIDSSLFLNEVTPANQPRTRLVGTTTNKVFYKTAKEQTGSFSEANICTPTTSPTIDQTWTGVAGKEGEETGKIEVTTTLAGGIYTHTIVLKGVTLKKDHSSFYLGSRFTLGSIERR